MGLRWLRQRAGWPVEDHTQTLRVYIPTHDIERVRPGVLPAHLDGGDARLNGMQYARCGPIPKKRRGGVGLHGGAGKAGRNTSR